MAIVNTKATAVTNADATNPVTNNPLKIAGGRCKAFVGVCEAASGDSIDSVYRFARVHTSWRIERVLLSCDAITTCAGDVGVFDVAAAGGAAIDRDFFASAQSLASALVHTDVTHEADAADAGAGYGLADCEKTLGAALGLTTDKWVDIAVQLTAAAGSAGTIVGKVHAIDNN